MSNAAPDMATKQDSLTETDILQYIKAHPEFAVNHPEIFELLGAPAPTTSEGVADFQSFMINRLRADKDQVLQNTKELVENARSNMNNQQRIHRAVLRLLEAQTFDDFIRCLTLDLTSILDVDIAVLLVESNGNDIPHVHQSGVRVLPEGKIDAWMGDKPVLLQDNISGIEAVYGGGAALVCSQIMLRVDISLNTPPAIVAFGSRNPDMFQDGQATDQVLFLARVIERCFRTWLHLPA